MTVGQNVRVLKGLPDSLDARGTRLRWWFATRGFALLVAGLMMLHQDWKHLFDDLDVYARWGLELAQGRVPYEDPMWQYPPLAAFVFGGIGLLGSKPWMFAILFVLVDVAISVLLARDARQHGRWQGFAVWLAAPILIGPIMYGRYDVIPTVFALGGLLAMAAPVTAGVILAIGGGLKVWPAVMGLAISQRSWLRGALGAGVTGVVIIAVSAWVFPGIIAGFVDNGEARGLQTESVAALPFVWARMFVANDVIPEEFRYGSSEVGHPLADQVAALLVPLTLVGLLVLIVVRLIGRLDRVPPADIAFVAILWLMATSRVLSPQYNVWLVGMAALVWALGSARMRRATVPVAVTAVTAQALYPFCYVDIIDGGFVGVAVQTVRIFALVASLVMAVRILRDEMREPGSRVEPGDGSSTQARIA